VWGDKEDQSIPIASLRMVMLTDSLAFLLVHHDHTRSKPHVQLFVAGSWEKFPPAHGPIGINDRYYLSRKVLRQMAGASVNL
jgi:hypothetical protein